MVGVNKLLLQLLNGKEREPTLAELLFVKGK